MTRYSLPKYRWIEIIVAEDDNGVTYTLPNVVDRYGNPYVVNRLSKAKQMISRVLHGNSKNYRLSTN
jgi:predicted SpoU family rRNA methylase